MAEPDLGDAEIAAVVDCIRSGWLSMGPRTREFEAEFAAMHGVKHALAVANGTAALHMALLALGVGEGADDEVVQPSLNFVAAANVTRHVGARPVFADIVSLQEPTIDPAEVAARIGPRTKAVVVMHYGGYPVRMAEIADICASRNVPLIEDACHAPGLRLPRSGSRAAGAVGDIGCYSFFSNKNMTCGEGGMVVTQSDALAGKLRALRSHGMTTLSWDRHFGRPSSYDVTLNGLNYRIDDLRASLALAQFHKLEAGNARRRDLAARYAASVRGFAGMDYVFGAAPEAGVAHLAVITVDGRVRDHVRLRLGERGIQTSLHYPPIHKFTAFKDGEASGLPITEQFSERAITLPLYTTLPDYAPGEIIAAVATAMQGA